MKKLVALALVTVLVASAAYAVVDPDPNSMGIYFDTNADVVCTNVAPGNPLAVNIILVNPTVDTVDGFECEVDWAVPGGGAPSSFFLNSTFPVAGNDFGSDGAGYKNYLNGYGVGIPATQATLLVTMNFYFLDSALDFTLKDSTPASAPFDGQPKITYPPDDLILSCSTSAGTNGELSAQVNAATCGVVASESSTLGAVKALFR